MPYKLVWRGNEVANRIEAAAVVGTRAAAEHAVQHAKSNHPWQSVTGEEEASIRIHEVKDTLGKVSVIWGADSPAYMLELGTRWMEARPFLRPAADASYPRLAGLIRASVI